MAHFSESLCEEVIRTEGRCGLSKWEMTQMARFALQAIRQQNPLMPDALRYRWLRSERLGEMLKIFDTSDMSDVGLDHAIFTAMAGGHGPEAGMAEGSLS